MVLLALPVSVPVGPMYWDVLIYYDAANRIFGGQVPSVDFFAPVGPLGYYLFAGWLYVFPNGQPVLLAHWSLLAVTAPLMALVVADVDRRARTTAFALLIPFLIFALLPFNTREFYPFPGSDGFGIYNRQCCQLLYVLVAAIAFMRSQKLLAAIVCATSCWRCSFSRSPASSPPDDLRLRLRQRPAASAAHHRWQPASSFSSWPRSNLPPDLSSHYVGDILAAGRQEQRHAGAALPAGGVAILRHHRAGHRACRPVALCRPPQAGGSSRARSVPRPGPTTVGALPRPGRLLAGRRALRGHLLRDPEHRQPGAHLRLASRVRHPAAVRQAACARRRFSLRRWPCPARPSCRSSSTPSSAPREPISVP